MFIKLQFDSRLKLDYLGFLFPRIPGDSAYKVSTREPLGELLCARVRESWHPVAEPSGELVATLDLPLNPDNEERVRSGDERMPQSAESLRSPCLRQTVRLEIQ